MSAQQRDTEAAGTRASERDSPRKSKSRLARWLKELSIVVVTALLLSFIIKTFFFQSFWIPSSSMEPTLNVGDRILVTKWRPGPMDLRHGDVVVFRDPNHWLGQTIVPVAEPNWFGDIMIFIGLMPGDAGQHLVKRVIGLPGDTVECRGSEGPVYVNGVATVEPYVIPGSTPCAGGPSATWTVTVPADYVWVMGDNRPGSQDSRYHTGEPGGGAIPVANIVGSAFVTVWPLDHWGGIGNPLAGAESAGSPS